MNKTDTAGTAHETINTGNSSNSKSSESVSRRVADELHNRIDKAADKSEKFERTLHERGAQASDKAREMGVDAQEKAREWNNSFVRVARNNPWAVVGGAVAVGLLLGAITRRR